MSYLSTQTSENSQPKAIFLMGGSGSGKGTVRQNIIDKPLGRSYKVIDPDLAKEKIPGYVAAVAQGDPDAAKNFHAESLSISDAQVSKALIKKKNIIYDATGARADFYRESMEAAKQNGYRVQLVLVEADVELCVERAKARKRVVPEEVVRNLNQRAKDNFPVLQSYADVSKHYDTNGSAPVLKEKVKK